MDEELDFEPPGPGRWELDRSHFIGGATPLAQWVMEEATDSAFRKLFVEMGMPAETLSMKFVNGFTYTRLIPLVGADRSGGRPPPGLVIKLVSRLHPEFRRRNRQAERTLAERPWRVEVDRWNNQIRPTLEEANLALQDVDLGALDDRELGRQIDALLDHLRSTMEEHFRLHGYDLGPLGMMILEAQKWGFDTEEVLPVLAGASPSTAAPVEVLAGVAAGLAERGVEPTSLDEVRAADPEIADQLDEYLRHRGSVLYCGYDIDTPTLGESPDVVLKSILAARGTAVDHDPESAIRSLRERVPEADRARFDELVADARAAMDMRDDNGPLTAEWPGGLLRLALLEAGRRLVERGELDDPEHTIELTPVEMRGLPESCPPADVVADRAARRQALAALDPPLTLGPPESPPPLDALPDAMRTMIAVTQALLDELGISEQEVADESPLVGAGIGQQSFTGVARTATTAEEAIVALTPGEILVTRTTSPAYNMVLGMVGGLVTAEGGPMSHAAVLSRELGIPAVVGAKGALDAIADGDTITVDPVAGRVEVVASGAQASAAPS